MFKEEDILKVMKSLDLTREEAIEMLQDDEDIERGESKDFDLTPEQQKVAKEMTKTGTRKTGEKVKRERKPNEDKRYLIQELHLMLSENQDIENENVTNIERQIDFEYNGVKYSVTLTAHREPKAKNAG